MTRLPSEAETADIPLLSVTGMADVVGITRHALHMRLARNHDSIPPPDRRLEGCHVWFATQELAARLGVTDEALHNAAIADTVVV